MRLHELQDLIDRFGPLATLGEIAYTLKAEQSRGSSSRRLFDSDPPGRRGSEWDNCPLCGRQDCNPLKDHAE